MIAIKALGGTKGMVYANQHRTEYKLTQAYFEHFTMNSDYIACILASLKI